MRWEISSTIKLPLVNALITRFKLIEIISILTWDYEMSMEIRERLKFQDVECKFVKEDILAYIPFFGWGVETHVPLLHKKIVNKDT